MGGQTKPGPGWYCQAVVSADAMHGFRCSGARIKSALDPEKTQGTTKH